MNNQLSLKSRDQVALQSFLQTIRAKHQKQVQLIALFGSKARGEDTPESDIDLLVVLRYNDWKLRRAMRILGAQVSLEHDVLLSIRAISPDEWDELTRYQFPLYRAIQAEGIVLFPPTSPGAQPLAV